MSTLLLVVRLLFTAQLLFVAVDFSIRTLLSFIAVLVVFYLTQERTAADRQEADSSENPLRQKATHRDGGPASESSVPADIVAAYQRQIAAFLLSCEPEESPAVQHFLPIQESTECIFAKSARLWGAREWNNKLSLEENCERSIPALIKFFATGLHCQLDGFVFELPCGEFGSDPESFGRGVRRLLTYLSEVDPAGVHCMRRSYIGGRGWCYEFNKTTIFVTTFAPFYQASHSRHAFGVDGCFVLLQPEYSFAAKNLPEDTPVTNWSNPQTVRDRIRLAYREAGREYLVRDTIFFSPALDMVKPLEPNTDEHLEWWKDV